MIGRMVRLSSLPTEIADGYRALPLPAFESTSWAVPPALKTARLAIVTTAGLHRRDDARFAGGSADYRLIPGDADPADIIQSHVSINFDRSVFQQDINAVFPLWHLRDMQAMGEVGALARWHYSFMGATDPTRMVEAGKQVASLLKEDSVDAVILTPV
jgi:D-proline reductase (dithiol) PrdB